MSWQPAKQSSQVHDLTGPRLMTTRWRRRGGANYEGDTHEGHREGLSNVRVSENMTSESYWKNNFTQNSIDQRVLTCKNIICLDSSYVEGYRLPLYKYQNEKCLLVLSSLPHSATKDFKCYIIFKTFRGDEQHTALDGVLDRDLNVFLRIWKNRVWLREGRLANLKSSIISINYYARITSAQLKRAIPAASQLL